MKFSFRYLVILSFATMIYLVSCTSDNAYIRKHQWKYSEGSWIGDWLKFGDKYYVLRNDTIFVNDTAKAFVEKVEIQIFADNVLLIKTIKDGKTGRYCIK